MNTTHDLIIIGAGFGGIALGAQLRKVGLSQFIILEAESGVGGTWWLNRYPGSGCDVQSHLYSLSFAPNPHWSREFASRQEIQAYLERTVADCGLGEHIHLNCKVLQAAWQPDSKTWSVTDSQGHTHRTRYLVSAVGGLARPAFPHIEGLETFQGQVIHSQHWPDRLDLTDKRVAVIGTGASAVQLIPHIARQAKSLTIFQRTPNWILPKPDRPISRARQRIYQTLPALRYLKRAGLFLLLETRLPAFTRWPKLAFFHRKKALRHLRSQVHDRDLIKQLTPSYAMGCKRVLMSNDFYPTLNEPHVTLITAPIKTSTTTGLTDQTGTRHDVDVIILATGFQATSPIPPGLILGRNQQDLAEHWQSGPEAYKGMTSHGFPNFFMLLGPNTALGHNSVLLMIEAQVAYIVDALKQMKALGLRSFEIEKTAQDQWQQQLDRHFEGSVWTHGGCNSWYLHPKSLRNTTLWPQTTLTYKRLTRRFDLAAYQCE